MRSQHAGSRTCAGRQLFWPTSPRVVVTSGKVDTGFDTKTRRDIGDTLEMRADSPFEESVPEPDAVFCKPDLRVPIEFVDFTETGLLRRPVFSRVALF